LRAWASRDNKGAQTTYLCKARCAELWPSWWENMRYVASADGTCKKQIGLPRFPTALKLSSLAISGNEASRSKAVKPWIPSNSHSTSLFMSITVYRPVFRSVFSLISTLSSNVQRSRLSFLCRTRGSLQVWHPHLIFEFTFDSRNLVPSSLTDIEYVLQLYFGLHKLYNEFIISRQWRGAWTLGSVLAFPLHTPVLAQPCIHDSLYGAPVYQDWFWTSNHKFDSKCDVARYTLLLRCCYVTFLS
jgi:hypothetical protein